MKYTKEYCRENKIAIHVIEISQLKKVEKILGTSYSDFGCNITYLKYSNQYLVPYKNVYGDVYGKSKNYTIITFEELMQDLNEKEMKEYRKEYKHKNTGQIAFNYTKDFYSVTGSSLTVPKEWIENSNDWEEIKPEFKVGDFVYVLGKDKINALDVVNKVFKVMSDEFLPGKNLINLDVRGQLSSSNIDGGYYLDRKFLRLATSEEILEYNKPKKGDYMIHIAHDTQYWTMGKIFQFGAYDFSTNDEMIFELKNNKIYSARAYTKNCRKATPEEIQAYKESQELRIGEHKLEIIQDGNFTNKAKFGCQQFDINELRTIRRLFDSNIQAKVNILGVDITGEFLDKVIAKF